MAKQNPTLALNMINGLKKAGLVESPATMIDHRYVVIGTRTAPGTSALSFISNVRGRLGDQLYPGTEVMLEQCLINYPGDGNLVIKLDFETVATASEFERNVTPILEDLSYESGRVPHRRRSR